MVDTSYMQRRYGVQEMIGQYLKEVKALNNQVDSPSSQMQLQIYSQAVSTFQRLGVKDFAKFALSFGRDTSPSTKQLKDAFPIVLGHRVTHPQAVDVAYAQVLLDYLKAFKQYRGNLKEWTLRFILSSRWSPLTSWLDQTLDQLIQQTQQNIKAYQTYL